MEEDGIRADGADDATEGEWPIVPVSPRVTVEVGAAPAPPSAEVLRAVDRVWAAARRETPALFNGRVFSADVVTADRIIGHWTEYRFVLAQIREPALRNRLRIRSLAVSGLLHTPDGIVLGRRSRGSVYQPGLWQCAPAGSVEQRDAVGAVDLAAQLAAELHEELGIEPAECEVGDALGAVEHPSSGIVDVGFIVTTEIDADTVRSRHRDRGNGEYETLDILTTDRLDASLRSGDRTFAPATRALLRRAALRRRTALRSPR